MSLDPRTSDDWYAAEPRTRVGMVEELKRIRRRTVARPLPVILIAVVLTSALTYKLATRKRTVEAEVILALTEGTLSSKHNGIPVGELKQFVASVLLPDAALTKLIERRDLYPLRHQLGPTFAITELRDQLEVEVWKNSFAYYDEDAEHAEHSARIGLTVIDTDPDRAFQLAHDLAAIVMNETQIYHEHVMSRLSDEIAALRKGLAERLSEIARARSEKQVARIEAAKGDAPGLVHALDLELAELDADQHSAERELRRIAQSRDALAAQIAAAGLDLSVRVVEEHRPERPEHTGFITAMIAVVVAIGTLLGAALVLGAFDPRIHDTDDVARLGLPVLGHVPGFPGDHLGSLESRGAAPGRVPSFLRWRSHR